MVMDRLVSPPERAEIAWVGGSIVGSINRDGRMHTAWVGSGAMMGNFLNHVVIKPDLAPVVAAAAQRLAWARCLITTVGRVEEGQSPQLLKKVSR